MAKNGRGPARQAERQQWVSAEELLRQGRLDDVQRALLERVRAGHCDFSTAHAYLRAARARDDRQAPGELVRAFTERLPDDSRSWRLAYVYREGCRDWTGCLEAVDHCDRLGDRDDSLQLGRAFCLERTGRLEEALEALETPLPGAPESAVQATRANASFRLKRDDFLVEELWPWLCAFGEEDSYVSECWNLVGKALDRQGRYREAFECFERANAVTASVAGIKTVDSNDMRRQVETMAALTTHEWAAGWKSSPAAEYTPVFLIGFPRSGTTLLEQILDAHPDIRALEEKPTVASAMKAGEVMLKSRAMLAGRIRRGMDWKAQRAANYAELANLSDSELEKLREQYFSAVSGCLEEPLEGRLLVDKMPLNAIHIPFILRLFPQARFIVALRHPCDCVLSAFMQNFRMNDAMANFLDLRHAASFYRHVMGLMEQYRQVFGLDSRMHYIRYEDLVTDFQGQVRELLTFLGLEWDPAVEAHDEHARRRSTSATPSYHAVTQKLYRSALGRWEHYREHLEPVLPHLRDACRRYGYELS